MPAPQAPTAASGPKPLETTGINPGVPVKPGTELRILPLGDSLTVGYESSDGNGYRGELLRDLSGVLNNSQVLKYEFCADVMDQAIMSFMLVRKLREISVVAIMLVFDNFFFFFFFCWASY